MKGHVTKSKAKAENDKSVIFVENEKVDVAKVCNCRRNSRWKLPNVVREAASESCGVGTGNSLIKM